MYIGQAYTHKQTGLTGTCIAVMQVAGVEESLAQVTITLTDLGSIVDVESNFELTFVKNNS